MLKVLLWLKGSIFKRGGRHLGVALGVAITVSLLASMGAFISSSARSMTSRAIANIPVDWQILLRPGSNKTAVKTEIGKAIKITSIEEVGYADAAGFVAQTGASIQTTGPGKVLGISPEYWKRFPAQIRHLLGKNTGVLAAQQTAANLHVTIGDKVSVERVGLAPVELTIDGIIDLPNADSLFQAIGMPAGVAPQAPPDNVLLVPDQLWHKLFDPQMQIRPDSVRSQLHVKIAHDHLPGDPTSAYLSAQRLANNVEARIAGNGIIGDNLASRLDGVREDALYARVLFLFLGLPGTILAVILTLAVTASGKHRRRREQALLRTRGASRMQIFALAGVEAILVALVGTLLGFILTYVNAKYIAAFDLRMDSSMLIWILLATLAGILLTVLAVLYPAWNEISCSTVAAARAVIGKKRKPLWQRTFVDVILLILAMATFWRTTSSSYQLVLAPEGVAQTSVDYQAFIAPLCLWIGGALLFIRLWSFGIERGKKALAKTIRPIAHGLSTVVASSLSKQRFLITNGIVIVALAFSFAVSTAIFNTTYNAQSHVDAELTNGADITVTGSTSEPPSSKLSNLKLIPSIIAIQPMQHRFAYVGNDLQDIFGIDPLHISDATNISDAYFKGGNAKAMLSALANRPDGVLVSEETVTDFQLKPGDKLILRLQNARDHQYHAVPFHFIGVAREFPTAPKDSFLVANASYIAQQTGSSAAETILIRTRTDPKSLLPQVRSVVNSLPGVRVTDIGSTQSIISSSLTAVDLRGLTRLELIYALLLILGATGLVLALGLVERKRTFSILAALGANRKQLGSFLWSEGLLILVGGVLTGLTLGFIIAEVLVKVLTGVFDPPPQFLFIPWSYLTLILAAGSFAVIVAVFAAQAISQKQVVKALRQN
ncbi:FtsX-like permease family protein [Thermincola ferriacetica]|uniref:FtsX-like permease family protein n=1 Tax=Thermincola ferriacetica TaxID=281456 RepID=A0A0L6W2S5_9FIRM|nr:FtsX-like permease family protein [Thermincola ferriacetica]